LGIFPGSVVYGVIPPIAVAGSGVKTYLVVGMNGQMKNYGTVAPGDGRIEEQRIVYCSRHIGSVLGNKEPEIVVRIVLTNRVEDVSYR